MSKHLFTALCGQHVCVRQLISYVALSKHIWLRNWSDDWLSVVVPETQTHNTATHVLVVYALFCQPSLTAGSGECFSETACCCQQSSDPDPVKMERKPRERAAAVDSHWAPFSSHPLLMSFVVVPQISFLQQPVTFHILPSTNTITHTHTAALNSFLGFTTLLNPIFKKKSCQLFRWCWKQTAHTNH